ncbi:MAG: carbon starvation CstA 5TM domain-containing protein, partial [Bacteroidaceae bacterium]
ILNRLVISVPLFLIAIALVLYSQTNSEGFNMIWRYFSWFNQILAVFTLWTVTAFLTFTKRPYWITLVPALFMTSVCMTYICIAPEGLQLSAPVSYGVGVLCMIIAACWFFVWEKKVSKNKKI